MKKIDITQSIKLMDIDPSVLARLAVILKKNGIKNVKTLCLLSEKEFKSIKGIGDVTASTVTSFLLSHDLRLGMSTDELSKYEADYICERNKEEQAAKGTEEAAKESEKTNTSEPSDEMNELDIVMDKLSEIPVTVIAKAVQQILCVALDFLNDVLTHTEEDTPSSPSQE